SPTDQSQQIAEFINGRAGLPDDTAQRSALEGLPAMDRDRGRSRWVGRMDQSMMAAGNTNDDKPSTLKSPNGFRSRDAGQSRHAATATVSLWMTGSEISSGIGSPRSRRLARTSSMASLAMLRASASVSPSVTTSGSAGTWTTKPPSSAGSNMIV